MGKLWLTDEESNLVGYRRAKFTVSDNPSLVRVATATTATSSPIDIIRKVGSVSTTLQWVTDPLKDTDELGADLPLTYHIWGAQDGAANAALRFGISLYRDGDVTALFTQDVSLTTAAAVREVKVDAAGTGQGLTLIEGDRFIFTLQIVPVSGSIVAGYNVNISYNGMYARAEGYTWIDVPDHVQQSAEIPEDDVLAVRTILRDQSDINPLLDSDEIVRYIKAAINTYSVDDPRVTSYLYSGDGATFDFPLPSKWVWDQSRIIRIEYPAGNRVPIVMELIDYQVRDGVLGTQPYRTLRFKTSIPAQDTDNIEVFYTTTHAYSTEYSTIPPDDIEPVLWLAGSYCAAALASRGAGATDSSINTDAINYRDMESRWGSVAKRLKDMYMNRVVNPDNATPVGFTEEWSPVLRAGVGPGADFLWHGRRARRPRVW